MDNDKQLDDTNPQVNPKKTINPQTAQADDPVMVSDGVSTESSNPPGSGEAAGSSQKSGQSQSLRPMLFFLIILLLFTIAAGMAGGWWLYSQQQRQPVIQDDLAALHVEVRRLQQALVEEHRLRSDLVADLSQADRELALKMNHQASRIEAISTPSRKDWQLAEAEYLLRLGNQRLLTERDSYSALALLQSADSILRDLDEVELLPVREVLAKNIVALKSAPMTDTDGLYLELKALAGQVDELPMLAPRIPHLSGQLRSADSVADQSGMWYDPLVSIFHSTLNIVAEVVRIRHREEVIEPMLSPQQEQLIRLRLATLMELAQLAMLREQQVVYDGSLALVQQLLADYFQLNEEQSTVLVEQLSELQQRSVVQPRTDISAGLNALRDYIDSWQQRHDLDSQRGQQR
ncbi:uroporphyrinogen-III C-methyltransferase [Porticoccus sp.]|uniref:uroporphyrinogen-III C-methyltransferase n=1 Tax=Porticoccus sp. TaxID=2024853 RepID=UPI003F697F3F